MKNLLAGLGAAVVAFGAAYAAPMTVNFDVTITSGPNTGDTAVSALEFDDFGQTTGVVIVSPVSGNLIDLDFVIPTVGTFDEEDDVDFPDFPVFEIDLDAMEVILVDFIDFADSFSVFGLEGFYDDGFTSFSFIINDGPQNPVPVPGAALLFAPALAGFIARRRKAS